MENPEPRRRMLAPDAAFCIQNGAAGHLYVFKNRQFACWDLASERMLAGYPKPIDEHWPGVMDHYPDARLRAALHVPRWGNQIFFFFEDRSGVVVWDMAAGRLLETVDSNKVLPCDFPAGHITPVAAVSKAGDPVIYGFYGLEYVRWSVGSTLPVAPDSGYPRKTWDDWTDGIQLAPRCAVYVDWPNRSKAHSNRKIYFFMGDLYLRWDVPSHTRNYRLDIPTGWKDWPAFE